MSLVLIVQDERTRVLQVHAASAPIDTSTIVLQSNVPGKINPLIFNDTSPSWSGYPNAGSLVNDTPCPIELQYSQPSDNYHYKLKISYDSIGAFAKENSDEWEWSGFSFNGHQVNFRAVPHNVYMSLGQYGLTLSKAGEFSGTVQTTHSGLTFERPSLPSLMRPAGYQYFDKSLNRPIWVAANLSEWIEPATQTNGKLTELVFIDTTGSPNYPQPEVKEPTIPAHASYVYAEGAYRERLQLWPSGAATHWSEDGGASWKWSSYNFYGNNVTMYHRGVAPERNTSINVSDSGATWIFAHADQRARIFQYGAGWDGQVQTTHGGTTAQRPALPYASYPAGYQYFDTTNNRPIYVNAAGTGWVESVTQTQGRIDPVTFVDTPDWAQYPEWSNPNSSIPYNLELRYKVNDDSYEERLCFSGSSISQSYREGGAWKHGGLTIAGHNVILQRKSDDDSVPVNLTIGQGGVQVDMKGTTQPVKIVRDLGGNHFLTQHLLTNHSGTTAERPTVPNVSLYPTGYQFYDTTLDRPIWVRNNNTWSDPLGDYDISCFSAGTMTNSKTLHRFVAPRAFSIASGASGVSKSAANATASTTIVIRKNGTQFGTVVYGAGQSTGTVSIASSTSFAIGDVLSFHGPATADATLADVSIVLTGVRG